MVRNRLATSFFALASGALVTCAPPLSGGREPHSITVGHLYGGVCGGICICSLTKVREDGRVSTRSCLPFMELRQEEGDFTVSPAEVAEFGRILAPLRLGPMQRGNCAPAPPIYRHRRMPQEVVRWRDDHPASLVSCSDSDVDRLIDHALLAVGAYENGKKIDPAFRREAAKQLEEMDRHRYRSDAKPED